MSTIRTVLATALIATIAPLAVQAAPIEREEIILSAESCQPALPAFDGNIRKRPLAMQNEGTSNAFVTCAFRGVFFAAPSQKYLEVGLINIGTVPRSVACTMVDGRNLLINPIFIVKSVTVNAGVTSSLNWTPADNGGSNFIYAAVSCSLPPDVGIRYTARRYDEEIGD